MNHESKFEIIRTLMAVFISLVIALFVILLVSSEPIESLKTFVFGPLTKVRYMGNVIEMAIPLIFSGLATAILFQTNLFNLGAEGIYYFGGLLAAIIGITFNLPPVIHASFAIIVSGIFGALIMTIIGIFKAKWNASELVMSLMFNSILYGIGLYIFNYYFRDPDSTGFTSYKMKESSLLIDIVPGTRIHFGLIIALLAVFLVHLFLYKTKYGYAIRMTGINSKFAGYLGMDTVKIIILASCISGFIAGLGGSVEILGMYERYRWTSLPGIGFDGALVAMLAKNKPINVIFSAVFLAYIRIGTDMMARMTNVPSEMVYIIQAIIILLISGQNFLKNYKDKMLIKEAQNNG